MNIEESTKEVAAIAVRMNKHCDKTSCVSEIIERLSADSSYDVTIDQIDIDWRLVKTSDGVGRLAMGVIVADADIVAVVTEKLIDLNATKHYGIRPYTANIIFHRGKEDGGLMFTLKEGIRLQRDYMYQQETITVTGLATYDLLSHIPEMDSMGKRNISDESIIKI